MDDPRLHFFGSQRLSLRLSYTALRWPQQRDACCSPVTACSLSRPADVMAVHPRKTSLRLFIPWRASAEASLMCLHLLTSRYSRLGSAAKALTAPSLILPHPRKLTLHSSQHNLEYSGLLADAHPACHAA